MQAPQPIPHERAATAVTDGRLHVPALDALRLRLPRTALRPVRELLRHGVRADEGGLTRWGCPSCTPGEGAPHTSSDASSSAGAFRWTRGLHRLTRSGVSTHHRRPMQPWFGLHLPLFTFPDSPRSDCSTVSSSRHAPRSGRLQPGHRHGPPVPVPGVGALTDPMLEGWSTLAALARETSKVRLGTLVTGVTYRNPAFLAKTATTLDVISGGPRDPRSGRGLERAGARRLRYEFPPIGERMDRLDEALTIIRAMFTEDRPSFTGRHYRIVEALNVPRPIQPGGPRVMVGGGGEQRTLRIAAKHADMTHWFPLGLETLRHKSEVLERYCAEIGRDRPRSSARWPHRSSWPTPKPGVGLRRAAAARAPPARAGRYARADGRRHAPLPRRRISPDSRSTTRSTGPPTRSGHRRTASHHRGLEARSRPAGCERHWPFRVMPVWPDGAGADWSIGVMFPQAAPCHLLPEAPAGGIPHVAQRPSSAQAHPGAHRTRAPRRRTRVHRGGIRRTRDAYGATSTKVALCGVNLRSSASGERPSGRSSRPARGSRWSPS